MYNIDKYLPDGFFNDLVPQSDLHDLNLDWILHKMRKYEYTYYKLMDIINDAIEDKLDELLYTKIMSLLGFVNVVNPPSPLEGLDNTGASDNSAKLNAMFEWLKDNTQCLLYFPEGTYSVSNITVPSGVVMIGECKYDTIISVTGAASGALFKNALENITIANMTFKGNIQNQSTDIVCFGCPVNEVTVCNVRIMEFYRALDITSNGGQWRADMLDISGCTYGAIKIGTFVRDEFLCYPEYFVDPTTVYNFDKMVIGELTGNVVGELIINTTDYLTITNMEIQDNRATVMIDDTSNYSTYDFICNTREWERELIKMPGNHMYYNWRGVVTFNETDFIFYKTKSYNIDSAQDVTINTATLSMRSVTKDDYVSGGVYEDYAQQTTTIANNLHVDIMGNDYKEVVGESDLHVGGNSRTDVDGNMTDVIGGDYNGQSVNRSFTVNNNSVDVVSGNRSDTVHGSYTIDAILTDLTGNDFVIETSNPLTYRSPVDNGFFKSVPAKDYNGNSYNILTDYNSSQQIKDYISEHSGGSTIAVNVELRYGDVKSYSVYNQTDLDDALENANKYSAVEINLNPSTDLAYEIKKPLVGANISFFGSNVSTTLVLSNNVRFTNCSILLSGLLELSPRQNDIYFINCFVHFVTSGINMGKAPTIKTTAHFYSCTIWFDQMVKNRAILFDFINSKILIQGFKNIDVIANSKSNSALKAVNSEIYWDGDSIIACNDINNALYWGDFRGCKIVLQTLIDFQTNGTKYFYTTGCSIHCAENNWINYIGSGNNWSNSTSIVFY